MSLLPSLLEGLPPTLVRDNGVRDEGEPPVMVMPCSNDLLCLSVKATVSAAELELGLAVPEDEGSAALVDLLAVLTLEGGHGGLRAGALPGLALLALASATLHGGRAVLATLPANLDRRVRSVRQGLAELPPREQGQLAAAVSETLRKQLAAVRGAAEAQVGERPGLHLPEQLVADGLLLALDPELPAGSAERIIGATRTRMDLRSVEAVLGSPASQQHDADAWALSQALLRWDLAQALIARLAFLTRGAESWLLPGGPLGQDAAGQLVLPRGEVAIDGVVVALRLDALMQATAESASPGVARSVVDHAWQLLVDDQPAGLHVRKAGFGLSVFRLPLEALEFAERATRTLSGPRNLPFGIQGRSIAVGPRARIAAGVTMGAIWGGTDGVNVELDGPTVARAVALSCEPGWSSSVLAGISGQAQRDPRAGIRCDEKVWREALSAATRAGRPVVEIGRPSAPVLRSLPLRGWWESKGRRQVLVGRPDADSGGPAELVTLEANQLRALLERDAGATPSEDRPLLDDPASPAGLWDRARVLPRTSSVDPLRASSLMGADPTFEGDEDPGTAATELRHPSFNRRRASAEDETDDIVPGALAGSLSDLDIPAWDATGFSLPEYSQELSGNVVLPEGPPRRVGGYSLEVDDDYGFEDLEDRPTAGDDDTGEIDPTAHTAPGPGTEPESLGDLPPIRLPRAGPSGPDFDVFAVTEADARTLSADSGAYLLSGGPGMGGSLSSDEALPSDSSTSGGSQFLAVAEAEVAIEDIEDDEDSWVSDDSEESAAADAQASDGDWADENSLPSSPGEDLLDLDELLGDSLIGPESDSPAPVEAEPDTLDGHLAPEGSPGSAPPSNGAAGAPRADAAFLDASDAAPHGAAPDGAAPDSAPSHDAAPPVRPAAASSAPSAAPAPERPAPPPPPEPRRPAGGVAAGEIANLFDGYVVVRDMTGCYTFGLRDGSQLRDAHSYETGGDSDAAYRAFVQAKVAEGFVPRLDLWSPMPSGGDPSALDPTLLQRAYMAMLTG